MTPIWNVVLAVSDDRIRHHLNHLLAGHSGLRVIAEAKTGPSALELIEKQRPDLAVLDAQLPGLAACDVLRALPPRRWPLVIFGPRCDDSTRRLLDDHAFECLPASLDEAQVRSTFERATQRLGQADPTLRDRLTRLLAATERGGFVERIPVRHGGGVEIVELDEVDWIGAAGNYVELHCDGRRHLYRSALSSLVGRLDPDRFVRIHRSAVVNVQRVRELEPTPQGDYKLRLDSGAQLRLSRRFREALEQIAPSA